MGRWAKSMVVVLLLAIVGCGGGGGGDKTPPSISDVQVNPASLRFSGGKVTITAQVSDSSGVARVWAEVEKPSGERVEVTMNLLGGERTKVMMNLAGGIYQCEFEPSPNIRNDGQAETYKVWVRARDTKGNETPAPGFPVEGVSFTVQAPSKPPEQPTF